MELGSNFGYDPKPHLKETTVGNLVWHAIVFILTPVALIITACAIIIKIACAIKDIKLA
ncbi:MAG: hypothetical protein Q8N37_01285 [bacterium]|nr:hypothetical protein [bacterium]